MWRAHSLEKTLMLGKIEGRKRRGRQRIRWLDSISDSMDMSLSKLWEIVEDRGAWHATVLGVVKSQTHLSDWITMNTLLTNEACFNLVQPYFFVPGWAFILNYKNVSHILLFSHSVMSNSLRPHGLQHTRLPCTSSSPRAYSNSCPSSWWCCSMMSTLSDNFKNTTLSYSYINHAIY